MRDNVNDSNREQEWSIELTWDLRAFAPYAAFELKTERPWELKEILRGNDLPKTSNKNSYYIVIFLKLQVFIILPFTMKMLSIRVTKGNPLLLLFFCRNRR